MSPPPPPTSVSDTSSQLWPDSASHHGKSNLIMSDFQGIFFQQHWDQVCWSPHRGELLADAVCPLPGPESRDGASGLVVKVSNPSASTDPEPPPGPPSSPRQTSPPGGGSQPRPWWAVSCSSRYSRLLRGCPSGTAPQSSSRRPR